MFNPRVLESPILGIEGMGSKRMGREEIQIAKIIYN